MEKTTVTSKIELASTARSDKAARTAKDDALRSRFASAAIGMGWQLAVVVLLPIVGGYKVDQHNNSVPVWTLIGLALAMVGSIIVIRRALAAFGNFGLTPGNTAGAASGTPSTSEDSSATAKETER
jgi:F0F1-type ATP synthase assembly protein I